MPASEDSERNSNSLPKAEDSRGFRAKSREYRPTRITGDFHFFLQLILQR